MGRALVVVVLAGLAVACGSASGRETDAAPVVSISPDQVTTNIVGASLGQRAVLTEILAGLGPSAVEAITLGKPESDVGAPAGAVAIHVEVPEGDHFAHWHAYVVGKVFHRRSRDLHLPPVAWLSAANGGQTMGPWSAGRADSPALTLAQAREIANRIRAAAKENDARVVRLELIRPHRLGFVVVLQADEPTSFLLLGYEDVLKPLDDLRGRVYDGRYVEVLDGEGDFVLRSGAGFSVRDDVASCAPVLLIGSMSYDPPPCPAREHWLAP
jgi:hypothetical protein